MLDQEALTNVSLSPQWVDPTATAPLETTIADFITSLQVYEIFLILVAFCIFVVGILGNLLVVFVVVSNSHMRTITNMFIVNLAIGDLMVTIICLPPSILTDFTGNWYFGKTMCKLIVYIQYISVSVSVMTLTAISWERYCAIVYPLKFIATKYRAKIIILSVWVISIVINLPPPLVITMHHDNETKTFYCIPTWPIVYQNIFDSLIFLILYVLPMVLISCTYTQIITVLWKIDKSIAWDNNSASHDNTKTELLKKSRNGNGGASSSKMTYTTASGSSVAKNKMMNQLNARRKAAKMLISVAAMFAVCYFPIHILNLVRFIYPESPFLNNYAHIMYKIAHVLLYTNSAVNPLIYNLMSDNFRKEFRRVICCRGSIDVSNTNKDFALKYTSRTVVAANFPRQQQQHNQLR